MNNRSDLDVALDFLRRIPEGRWTNYGEIAECVNTIQGTDHSGYRVAMLMLHCDASEPWHRLRNAEGVFNVPAQSRESWVRHAPASLGPRPPIDRAGLAHR